MTDTNQSDYSTVFTEDILEIVLQCHAALAQDSPEPPTFYINQILNLSFGYLPVACVQRSMSTSLRKSTFHLHLKLKSLSRDLPFVGLVTLCAIGTVTLLMDIKKCHDWHPPLIYPEHCERLRYEL